ncbi:VanZ family protein [Oscillospiraceae bacterium 44-34]
MYLPFGILYPLFRKGSGWKRTVTAGVAVSLIIELLQPIFGRSFDINDIILNAMSVAVSAAVFYLCRTMAGKKPDFTANESIGSVCNAVSMVS